MHESPPLHLHILAHPQSKPANELATALMRRFVEPPANGGLRIPVFLTPKRGDDLPPRLDGVEGLDLNAAQHTIVVVLADERMVRTVAGGTGDAWAEFVQDAITATPLNSSPHHILPVALDEQGFAVSGRQHVLPALRKDSLDEKAALDQQIAQISFHIAARAIQLLKHGKVPAIAPDRMKAPVTIFLSHAKRDLDNEHHDDPVRHTRSFLNELPVEQWYDAKDIATSQDFEEAIKAALGDCSIMLAFQTDHYSSRPWCRYEVLEAKRLGAHVLVVDALQDGEPRSFPYGGNVPTVRWQFNTDPRVDAQRVIDRAVLEALRFKHNRSVLESTAERGERILAAAPEALTLANECSDIDAESTFLYPDPPLGREELQILQGLRPKARFLTPLTKVASWSRPDRIEIVTVSISESHDAAKYGFSPYHFQTLTDEIHLYLLLAGLKIAYGGALKGNFTDNFTLRLFDLVRAYSKLAEDVNAPALHKAIINAAPWPLRLSYGEDEWKLFAGNVADYQPMPRPDVPWGDDEIFPVGVEDRKLPTDMPPSKTPQQRYAWARGLTTMRERITDLSQCRLVVGGKLDKFFGIVPGVVEEACFSLSRKTPLYVAGGLGGAARAIADRLRGIARVEMTASWTQTNIKDYDAVRELYAQHGGHFPDIENLSADLEAHGRKGLEQALNNGLNDAENLELLYCTDPRRIAGLVLTGLSRLK